jgi:uncharacterized protein (TIGR00369 family)
MAQSVREWIERSPYAAALGVELEEASEARVRLRLPYRDDNSNPGKALHGGVAASMVALGGQALSRIALSEESGPWHTAAAQVSYLAAAIAEPIVAEASLLRKGKEFCFSDVRVGTEQRKPVAQGLVLVHGRLGRKEVDRPRAHEDKGESDPGPMGPYIGRVPFIAKLGIRVEHMAGGRSRLVMPFRETLADASGGVHEGAVLALLDTAGAMASWAVTGPGPYKASTPGVQARLLAPPPRSDLVACGAVRHRDSELFFADVEVAESEGERLVAAGTVIYRIVTD